MGTTFFFIEKSWQKRTYAITRVFGIWSYRDHLRPESLALSFLWGLDVKLRRKKNEKEFRKFYPLPFQKLLNTNIILFEKKLKFMMINSFIWYNFIEIQSFEKSWLTNSAFQWIKKLLIPRFVWMFSHILKASYLLWF